MWNRTLMSGAIGRKIVVAGCEGSSQSRIVGGKSGYPSESTVELMIEVMLCCR
jgi:hypothetical protein